jgi:hypothetical protein
VIVDFSKITPKFYKDEEIWDKARATEPYLKEFMEQVGQFVAELHIKGYRFVVFHINPEEGILHAALTYCCGARQGHAVGEELRHEVVEPILTSKTRYKHIVWEDLLLLGVK